MGTWRNLGRHKYGAQATVTAGIRFPSKAEARRWDELVLLERAGEIRELEPHPAYPIVVHGPDGRPRIVAVYVADSRYRAGPEGILTIEDVKGIRTPVYRLKKRLVEAIYDITITEIGGARSGRHAPTGSGGAGSRRVSAGLGRAHRRNQRADP